MSASTPPPRSVLPAFTAAACLGAIAGCICALQHDAVGDRWAALCATAALLGIPVGLLARHATPVAIPAFYIAGLATAGFLGHLNLLPWAMVFFAPPCLTFGAAAMAAWALSRCIRRSA